MLRHRIEKVLIVSGSFLILIKFELFYNNNRIDLSWLSVMCIYILFGESILYIVMNFKLLHVILTVLQETNGNLV